jgi:hypothetical protein
MEQRPTIIKRKQVDLNVDALRKVSDLLKTVNYGSITLVVQSGKVFQINKTENCKLSVSVSD